jgi:hypothetical protein
MDNYKYTPDSSLKNLLINIKQPESHITIGNSSEEIWAHIDKDMQVTHLDMELCAQGPHNMYTALAMAIWNKAVQEEREACAKVCDETLAQHYMKQTIPSRDEAMLLAACADCATAIRSRGNQT